MLNLKRKEPQTMSTKPISPERLAANRANAANSTGPRTPEGKARSSQNARKHTFDPAYYAVVRLESPEALANLVADAVDYYQPADSQERFAVERIALAQQEILRCAALQSGFFTTCLEEATERAGTPLVLRNDEMTRGLDVTVGQNRSYWLAEGFNRRVAKSNNSFVLVLRQQAQAERLYRRAVEEFDRLRARRQASLRTERSAIRHILHGTKPQLSLSLTGSTTQAIGVPRAYGNCRRTGGW
jgi:hypothetical protein